jgi:hypothetical protein
LLIEIIPVSEIKITSFLVFLVAFYKPAQTLEISSSPSIINLTLQGKVLIEPYILMLLRACTFDPCHHDPRKNSAFRMNVGFFDYGFKWGEVQSSNGSGGCTCPYTKTVGKLGSMIFSPYTIG